MTKTIIDEVLDRPIRSIKRLPSLVSDNALRHSVGRRLNQAWYTRNGRWDYNKKGVHIFEEDWDNLVILDSCRFDFFKEAMKRHELPGELEYKISRGSQTPEWLNSNFAGEKLHDTVYVSASVVPYHVGVEDFDKGTTFQKKYSFNLDVHHLENLWESPPDDAIEVHNTTRVADYVIPADTTAEKAIEIAARYPNKRLIVHIVPPHLPYLGPTGQEIHQKSATPWQDTFTGDCSFATETLVEAYRENVDHAVSAAGYLIEQLRGKTVITADHGEFLFDRSSPIPVVEHLHPAKTYTEELVKVPWLVADSDHRKVIEAEEPRESSQLSSEGSQSQLEALGYI
ncbi:hypothetical protein [Haloarcula amylolytica]|uniref:hypothetical protein n=1 Tax=Haloarcula amylolytica TaxID=396317 RepID=UPI003C70E058